MKEDFWRKTVCRFEMYCLEEKKSINKSLLVSPLAFSSKLFKSKVDYFSKEVKKIK
jgi:hypothetical protein